MEVTIHGSRKHFFCRSSILFFAIILNETNNKMDFSILNMHLES